MLSLGIISGRFLGVMPNEVSWAVYVIQPKKSTGNELLNCIGLKKGQGHNGPL